MNYPYAIFYTFLVIAAASAFFILFATNVFKAALLLLTCLMAVAALYVLAFAEFAAVTQILVYAGGILVVIIFGIMLTSRISGKALLVTNGNLFAGALVFSTVLMLLIYHISGTFLQPQPGSHPTGENIASVGISLMTSHALPFEISAIILLVALVGAAVTTSFMKSRSSE